MNSPTGRYDAAVVGAGPVGSATAVALARAGQRVLLLEGSPKAAGRFAGEWLHPPAVKVLERLGLGALEGATKHPGGLGFVVWTDDAGEPIRLPYAEAEGLSCDHQDLVEGLRARAADVDAITYMPNMRVTGIDGHTLSCENRTGHTVDTFSAELIVGADGRGSFVRQHLGLPDQGTHMSHMAGVTLSDVEIPFEGFGHVLLGGPGPILMYRIAPNRVRMCLDVPTGMARDVASLWDGFAPVLPEPVRVAFRASLMADKPVWAANGFRPRICYGRGHVALVGDAVGHFHPLTAAGITMGLLDSESLVASDGNLEQYAKDREARSYVPELLANALYQVFVREDRSAVAIRHAVFQRWRESEAERKRTMRILAGDATGQIHFGRAFVRMAVEAVTKTASEGAAAGRWLALPRDLVAFGQWAQWPAASFLPRALREASRADSRPGRALPLPAARTPATHEGRKSTIEKRPKAPRPDHVSQWMETAREIQASSGSMPDELALIAAVAATPTAAEIDPDVERALRATPEGAPRETGMWATGLGSVRRAYPGLRPRQLDDWLTAACEHLRRTQEADGSWESDVETTAVGLLGLAASGAKPVEPPVRQAMSWLVDAQRDDGSFGVDPTRTALALGALLAAQAPTWASIDRAAHALLSVPPASMTNLGRTLALVALARYEERRDERPTPTPAARTAPEATPSHEEDWAFCAQSLLDVSRTFARPIEMLPGDLRTAVTCGYLLCRAVDTVEDHATLPIDVRDELYALFLDALEGGPAEPFATRYASVGGEGADHELCRNLPRLMRVFRALPEGLRECTVPWVAEMARGMNLYSHRKPGPDGITALVTVDDLVRYCYFVAGTVGHMLTELFLAELGDEASPEQRHTMREHAESFGLGLQLVNILKDVTDDRDRRVSFIPRTACEAQRLSVSELLDPAHRERAHLVVAPIFDVAQTRLERALEYSLAIPATRSGIRLFCLLPLWMAARTLVLARGNDKMFVPGEPVKITRAEVEQLITQCVANAGDNAKLRQLYETLWQPAPLEPPAPPREKLH